MLNSIFMLSKYLKKTVTTALILGLMISPILPATQSISSSISIATQAAEIEVQLEEAQAEEAQAANGNWSEYTNTAWYDENKNEYSIRTAEELAGLAQLVNDGTDEFADKTIKLANDIDLGDHYWVPIGVGDYSFQGTFDGQGRTIKNMKIGEQSKPASYDLAAFFGVIENATIENVTIGEGSYVYSSDDVAGICAITNDSTIKNCINRAVEISSASEQEDGMAIAGGIVSQVNSGKTEIIDCVNYSKISANSYINTDGDAASGGIVGFIKYDEYHDPQLSISKCINYGDVTSTSSAGGICGYASTKGTGTFTINDSINVGEISAVLSAGGLIGEGKPSSSIINNTYYKKGSVTTKYKEQNRAIGNKDDKTETIALSEDKIEEKANEILAEIKERNKDISTETNTAADTNAPADEGANTDEEVAAEFEEMRLAIPSTGQNAGAQEGWQQIGGYIYYYEAGVPLTNQWQIYNNFLVYLGQSGSVINIFGYLENNNWVYYEISQNSCNRITGVRQIGNRQFYFSNGTLIANKGRYKDTNGTEVYVDSNANVILIKDTNGLYYTTEADGTKTIVDGEFEVETGVVYVFNNGTVLYDTWYPCADGIVRYIGANGIINNSIEGRIENGASDYTYYSNGVKYHGLKALGSKQYLFNNGQMVEGGFYTYYIGDSKYACYVNNSGEVLQNLIGTFDAGRNTFIFKYNGQLCSGEFREETGDTHVFDNGIKLYDTWHLCADGIVRYVDANGIIDNSIEGRMENGASDYTYYSNGVRCDGFITIGSKQYYFNNGQFDRSIEGRMENGASDYTYYSHGVKYHGLKALGSKQYLFNNGQMVKGGFYTHYIGNSKYACYVNKSGELLQNFIGTFDAGRNTFIFTYNGQLCSGEVEVETGVTYVFNNGIILQ